MELKKIKVNFECITRKLSSRGVGESGRYNNKGDPNGSEIIFRITLLKEDEEAMPPMEDEAHYNPVTPQELSVLKSD